MSRTGLNETEYPIGFMCLKIKYLLIHCLAPSIVLCLHGKGYQIVPVQSSPGNGRRVEKSNTQDKHGPNCFLQ